MFVDHVNHGVVTTMLDHIRASTGQMAMAQFRVLGGAMARVPADATAFAHRKGRILVNLAAIYESPDDKATHEAWVAKFADAIRQNDTGAYVNFVGDERENGVHSAYPDATWRRLAEIKRRYDPDNTFRRNQNIPPA